MPDLDNWMEILSTLRRNLLRTALTAIGVYWGVLMLIVMVGFGNGLQGGVRNDMAGLATDSMYVWGDRTALPFDGLAPGRWVNLTRADALALEHAIPQIEAVAPRAQLGGRSGSETVTRGTHFGSFNVWGDVPAFIRIQPEKILAGRFLNELDIEHHRKVAVIGYHVAEILFPNGMDPIGQTVRIKSTEFTVVGVFRPMASGDRGDRVGNTMHLPITTFQQILRTDPYVNNLAVLMRPDVKTENLEQKIRSVLAKRHRFSIDDKQAVGTWDAQKEFTKITGLFTGISLLIWFVGTVTMVAGIIGVSNIMMISVRERTREIGIRRAIGATPWSVVAQILKESTALTGLAGYFGLLSGFGALELVGFVMAASGTSTNKTMFTAPTASLGVAIAATLTVIVGGAIAGLFPALYAVRVRPVIALKDE